MAQLIVKNTFLDIADHKFLRFEEPCGSQKRCHSVPRTWKPIALPKWSGAGQTSVTCPKRSLSIDSTSSTLSDVSCSTRTCSFGDDTLDGTPVCCAAECVRSPFMEFNCATPTSEFGDVCAPCFSFDCSGESGCSGVDDALKSDSGDTSQTMDHTLHTQDLSDFLPEQGNATLYAITEAVHKALLTSGETQRVRVEPGVHGTSPTLIAAEIENGPRFSSRCYSAVHVARKALEEITADSKSVFLLSKRVQKEDRGFCLRSSIACIPKEAEGHICWDLFHKGQCPRRKSCAWYHPQESDIFRVKVSVRAIEERGVTPQDQLRASVLPKRHKISLGDLV